MIEANVIESLLTGVRAEELRLWLLPHAEQVSLGILEPSCALAAHVCDAGEVAATGSFLRAVIATGVVVVDEDGFFVEFDFTRPAVNGSSGAAKCPNA